MINPTDFHKTAEFLKDQQDEWHVRTSVNRSYYGVFLYFREFFDGRGVDIPKPEQKKSQHQFIIQCFKKSMAECKRKKRSMRNSEPENKIDDKVTNAIYNRLKTLFQDRTNADYKLHLKFPPSYSKDSLRRATTTIQDFAKLRDSATEKLIVDVAKRYGQLIKMQATGN